MVPLLYPPPSSTLIHPASQHKFLLVDPCYIEKLKDSYNVRVGKSQTHNIIHFLHFKDGKQCPREKKVLGSVHEPQGVCRIGVQEENKSEGLVIVNLMLKLRKKVSFTTT